MIESSLAFTPQQENSAFKQWQSSMATSRARIGGAAEMRYDLNDRTAGPLPVFGTLLARETLLSAGMSNALVPGSASAIASDAKADIAYNDTEGDSFQFADIIDMVNPLQHLPVVGMLYRKFTGDTMKPIAQIIGGAVFGGPIGAVGGTINAVVQSSTGKDLGDNMVALVSGEESFKAKPPAITIKKEESVLAADILEGTTLAIANLSVARDGRNNFAAKAPISNNRWNA